MAIYTYEQIKNAAKRARADLCQKGQRVEKTSRQKPRQKEKVDLLMERALNRIQKYKPYRRGDALVFPYFLKIRS